MYKAQIGKWIGLIVTGAVTAFGAAASYDFDGDRKADFAVYHSARGDWYIRSSRTGQLRLQQWGWNQSQPVAGDFDGDGKADLCVYDGRSAKWFILRSRDNATAITSGWGSTEQDPVVGDFDGDRISDLALYHPASGNWNIILSSSGKRIQSSWGIPTAEPVPGDYDGDGKTDLAVYDRASGNWFIMPSSTGKPYQLNWGWAEAEPVQGDYDGDGKCDIAVFHTTTGQWYIRLSGSNGALRLVNTGWPKVQPAQADYDGDGKCDIAFYHAPSGNWLVIPSSTGAAYVQNWGWKEAEPASSAYRVDDDGSYYGHSYGHDYDDDTFERVGVYPRTGYRVPTATPVNAGGVVQQDRAPGIEADATDIRGARLVCIRNKLDVSGYRVTKRLSNATTDGSKVRYTIDGDPFSWGLTDGPSYGRFIGFARDPAGKLFGGHWDWFGPNNRNVKTIGNIKEGYWTEKPRVGEPFYFCIANEKLKERSNVVKVIWK